MRNSSSKVLGVVLVCSVVAIHIQGCSKSQGDVNVPWEKFEKWNTLMTQGEDALRKGDMKTAEPLLDKALVEAEKIGKDDRRVASTLNDLAVVASSKKDFAKAVEYSKRSLAIEDKLYGGEHVDVAYDLNNTGAFLDANKQHEEATPILERALKMRKKLLGEKDSLTAVTSINLAANYEARHQFKNAEKQYKETLMLTKASQRPDMYLSTILDLARLYLDNGQKKQAESLFVPGIEEALALSPETSTQYIKILERLGRTKDAKAFKAKLKFSIDASQSGGK